MLFEQWKDEDKIPDCKDFKPKTTGFWSGTKTMIQEMQIVVSREHCERRYGYPCIHADTCKNWKHFECMISKKGFELLSQGQE